MDLIHKPETAAFSKRLVPARAGNIMIAEPYSWFATLLRIIHQNYGCYSY